MIASTRTLTMMGLAILVLAGVSACSKPAPLAADKPKSSVVAESATASPAALAPPTQPSSGAEDTPKVPASSAGSWEIQNSGIQDNLYAVAFINDQIGVAVGDNRCVLKTADGGKSWRQVMEPRNRTDLSQVLLSSAKEGWTIASAGGTILHTTDGGDTWNEMPAPDLGFGGNIRTHAAIGSTYFYLTWGQGGNHLFQTTDAGKKWVDLTTKLPLGGYGSSTRLAFADPKHGYFVTSVDGGKLGRTEDGGKTWQLQKTEDKAGYDGPRICFVDKERGWYSLPNGAVYATIDAGKTWTRQDPGHKNGFLLDLHFTDVKLGHVLISAAENVEDAPKEVRRTTDGGKSWKSLGELKGAGRVHGVNFPSTSHGWVVGDKGYIAHYRVDK